VKNKGEGKIGEIFIKGADFKKYWGEIKNTGSFVKGVDYPVNDRGKVKNTGGKFCYL